MEKKRKKYKVVMTDFFKKQLDSLSNKDQKEIRKGINKLAKNPYMGRKLYPDNPNAEELRRWVSDLDVWGIDAVLEYLHDSKLLTKKGDKLAYNFWKKYIKKKPKKTKKSSVQRQEKVKEQ